MMAWRPRLTPRKRVVFALRVKLPEEVTRMARGYHGTGKPFPGPMIPDAIVGNYHLSTVEDDLHRVIVDELPRALSSLFDLDVEVKVLGKEYTSLTIFFAALLGAYPLIANYHDFAESVHLIKKHCALLADALDESKYGGILSPNVEVYYPTMPDPTDYPYRWMRHMFGHPGGEEAFALTAFMQRPTASHRRDFFFWYLVVMNIVLMALVGSLVYRSVVSTYFEQPTKAISTQPR